MTSSSLWSCTPNPADPQWLVEDGLPTARLDVSTGAGTWPAVQPGVFDASGGYRGHRVVVEFELQSAADAVLSLRFSAERGPCPDLEITLDGIHRGLFHPVVTRRDRTQTGEPGPVAGVVHLEVGLPAAWLAPGRHTLTVTTAIDRAAALGEGRLAATHEVTYGPGEVLPAARSHYGRWFGAYLRWSAVALIAVSSLPTEPVVALRPTPLFVHHDGAEAPLVDVDVTWAAGTSPPEPVSVEWPGFRTQVTVAGSGRDFGMFRARMPVPGFDAVADVNVRVGHDTHRLRVSPCRRWTLHLIPHVHLDLGFTDAQGKVLELHCRNIDRALARIDLDPDFRFCVDGSVVVAEYLRTRAPARIALMYRAIADGRIGINAFHSNFLTGVVGLEELYRSTDLALTLPTSTITGMRYANLTDVPTYSRSIPSVLADLGIEGFVGMSNHGRAATDTSDELHLLSPVRWQGPDGQEVLAHFADHYSQLRFMAADPQAVAGATNGLERYVERYERPDYLPTDLAVIGTHADNEDLADGDTGFVERWNAVFAWPRFRVSTFDEYLASVAPLADELPLWRSETGTFWEDGVGSAANEFAAYRRTQVLLPAAETLGALVSVVDSNVRTNRTELDRAWSDLSIAAEHTLTWSRSMSHPHASPVADQLGWKTRYINDAQRVAVDEMRRHLAQLSERADVRGPGFLVFNPHAWTADLDCELDLSDGVDLLDRDSEPIPLEMLSSCAGLRRVRLPLGALPAHSWRFLPMTAGHFTVPGGEVAPHGTTSEPERHHGFARTPLDEPIITPGWEVVLDPKTQLPRSIRHRPTGRELLDEAAAVRLGQIVRAGETRFVAAASDKLARPADVHGHRRERTLPIENFRYVADPEPSHLVTDSPELAYVGRKSTPDGMRLRWCGGGFGVDDVTVELLLRDDTGVCDLDVRLTKAPCLDMEAVYVCFPFRGTAPVLRYDRPLGWVCPSTDHGPGASNEWGAVTNTVSLQSQEGEVRWTPLDTPLFTTGDVVRGIWPTSFPQGASHLYSYAMNNFWPCNVPPWQPGPTRFRYRFEVAAEFDPAASTRFGRTARLGAQASEILPLDRFAPTGSTAYREGNLGLVRPDVDVDVQVRQGDDPTRLTLHLTNLRDHDVTFRAGLPDGLRSQSPDGAVGNEVAVQLVAFGVAHVRVSRL
ncbi:hypothetical protein BA895_21035 [Humibacillus sp. DSM 29435]|uniref:glycoside hydrolase family 38 N-terminal domain-containing protein n=1 Tax=Humibacillus sp. DSM 29435 TaxID=1869167 RepID=UPI00087216A2|nr:hypothetical protein [Humibacillus sp. DSM 29435]OFE15991.1 hypothetical protein BA895_21035 [Humibacillus sp. DSM 29435]